MIAKRDNKHRAVELLKSIFENNFYSQDERRMLSSMGAESTIHSTPANIIERILFYKFSTPAISHQRIELVSKILRLNTDLSIDDPLSFDFISTPLTAITANGCSAICVAFLNSSLRPNPFVKDNTGKNLLHLLLAKGHQINDSSRQLDFEDQRPLFEAVLNHSDIAHYINDQDLNGLTALHYAAARRDTYYIDLLISKGANPFILDNWKRNSFDIVIESEQNRINLIGSGVYYSGAFSYWNPSIDLSIYGFGQGRQLNYFCGYIDQTVFHQDSDKVIGFMNAKLSERAQKCSKVLAESFYTTHDSDESMRLFKNLVKIVNPSLLQPLIQFDSADIERIQNRYISILIPLQSQHVLIDTLLDTIKNATTQLLTDLKTAHTLTEYTDRCQRYQTTITTAITTAKIAIVDRPLLKKIWGDYIWPVLKSFANLGVILMNLCVGGGESNCRDQYSDFLKSEKTLLNEAISKLENTHYLFFKGSASLEEKTSVYDPHVALQLI